MPATDSVGRHSLLTPRSRLCLPPSLAGNEAHLLAQSSRQSRAPLTAARDGVVTRCHSALRTPEALVHRASLGNVERTQHFRRALTRGEDLPARQRQGRVLRVVAGHDPQLVLRESEHHLRDAGPVDRPGTHRARLGAGVEGVAAQISTERRAGQPHQVRLGVAGDVGVGDDGVLGAEHDRTVGVGEDRPEGVVPRRAGQPGLVDGQIESRVVAHAEPPAARASSTRRTFACSMSV